ncbi:MAG: AMP-binding protein, partial [bacterium]|nr:AMP-binding protein [bacterium]
ERFVKDSRQSSTFSFPNNQYPITNTHLYRTGDLCRWQPNGDIEFFGRIDHQVKIRGFRIELQEIENRLLTHDTVKEAVVIDRTTPGGEKYLCAYYVTDQIEQNTAPGEEKTGKPDAAALKTLLSQTLPGYMVPAYYVPLDKIPLTANEKLNRKALPEPKITMGTIYATPTNKTEEKLVEIWTTVLEIPPGHKPPGIDDNFFEIGGHSLKATRLVTLIHKELNLKIPLAEVFKHPTVRTMAGSLAGTLEERFDTIPAVETREYYPASSAQKR